MELIGGTAVSSGTRRATPDPKAFCHGRPRAAHFCSDSEMRPSLPLLPGLAAAPVGTRLRHGRCDRGRRPRSGVRIRGGGADHRVPGRRGCARVSTNAPDRRASGRTRSGSRTACAVRDGDDPAPDDRRHAGLLRRLRDRIVYIARRPGARPQRQPSQSDAGFVRANGRGYSSGAGDLRS